jgi:Concanavalin A-like lectin/glucanases superfamily
VGAYLNALLAHSPNLVWGFNEPSGTAVEDHTANNRDGTLTGGTRSQAGPITAESWTATLFDGLDDIVTRAAGAELEPAELTALVAFKRNGAQAQFDGLAMTCSSSAWNDGWGLYFDAAGTLRGFVNNFVNGLNVTIPDDTWTQVALCYSSPGLRINVDGVDVASGSPGGSTDGAALAVANSASTGGGVAAVTIACLAIIPASLTDTQLADIWDARDEPVTDMGVLVPIGTFSGRPGFGPF